MPRNKDFPLGKHANTAFTVIGFWPDTDQRFCDVVRAATASKAEDLCLQSYPGVAVCGVIAGSHTCVDASPYLTCN
jgi:hypothetical protein